MRRREYRDQKTLQWLHHIRNEELKAAMRFFPSDKRIRILEIGGGEGYVAKCISDIGYDVTSIDIAPIFPQLYPVLEVDATRLNFRSETFDLVFSCQVLPNVKEIERAFQEIKRVLKKDGIVIHTVPTTWWRLITSFWHYFLMPKHLVYYVIRKLGHTNNRKRTADQNEDYANKHKVVLTLDRLFNYAVLPVGTSPTSVHEIYYFCRFFWSKLFKRNGFQIICVENGPYLYSGYFVFKTSFLKFRKFMARCFISSSYCFVLKK